MTQAESFNTYRERLDPGLTNDEAVTLYTEALAAYKANLAVAKSDPEDLHCQAIVLDKLPIGQLSAA